MSYLAFISALITQVWNTQQRLTNLLHTCHNDLKLCIHREAIVLSGAKLILGVGREWATGTYVVRLTEATLRHDTKYLRPKLFWVKFSTSEAKVFNYFRAKCVLGLNFTLILMLSRRVGKLINVYAHAHPHSANIFLHFPATRREGRYFCTCTTALHLWYYLISTHAVRHKSVDPFAV